MHEVIHHTVLLDQKYDEGAAKAVASVLGQYGYQEDRGASCVMECAGSYKQQHDAGKNLKTVVVFPKVASTKDSISQQVESLIPEDSPGYKIAVSSMTVFKNMVKSKCPSWSQKKGCLQSIEALKELVQDLDSQLIKGTPLTDSEQAFYDSVVNLDEKEEYVRHEMQTQVETGNITRYEKELLLNQNAEKIVALGKEDKSTAKADARKELLESIEPLPPQKLKNHTKIGKLRKELVPLLRLEDETKGRLLNIKETKQMARQDEILEEIEYLEEASRGWFEDDDVFESRMQASRDEFAAHHGKSRKRGGDTSTIIDANTKVRVSVNKWVTPGEGRGFGAMSSKKKGKSKKGSVFGAMMMDSSDEEDDETGEDEDAQKGSDDVGPQTPASAGTVHKKKSKKKKIGAHVPRKDTTISLSRRER